MVIPFFMTQYNKKMTFLYVKFRILVLNCLKFITVLHNAINLNKHTMNKNYAV